MKRNGLFIISVLFITLIGCSKQEVGKSLEETSSKNVKENISQASSEISKETTVDGKTITTLADGTIIDKTDDGSTIETARDGSTKEIKADGTIIKTSTDGTITETKADGTVILFKTDGSKIETKPDGSTKEIQAATEAATVALVEVTVVNPIVVVPTEATVITPIVATPTETPVVNPIAVAPTEAPIENPIQATTEAPTQVSEGDNRYVLTSAETFLKQTSWSSINMNTSQNVFDQLCIIGDDFSNGKYSEVQAIAQIKQIKDSTKPEWWIFESYAKIINASGKIDCSTTALKQQFIYQLTSNIGQDFGDNKHTRVFYNPNTDSTIIYFVSVSGTTVHN